MDPGVAGTRRPELNAAGNDAAIEELTIAYEGLARDPPPWRIRQLGAWIRYEFC
jgi:hypothetical protein